MIYNDFAAQVQEALNHLYDATFLHRHPIHLMVSDAEDDLRGVQETRRSILSAIRSLRPGTGIPADAPDWRTYRILHFRYIEGLNPSETMDKIGLGKSHYFREQARAVELITQILWQSIADKGPNIGQPQIDNRDNDDNLDRGHLAQIEVDQLCAGSVWQQVAVSDVFAKLRPLLASLAELKQIDIAFAVTRELSVAHADPSLLRQAIFNLVSYALDISGASMIRVSDFCNVAGQGIQVSVERRGQPINRPDFISHRIGVGLEVCRSLAEAMDGRMEIQHRSAEAWSACLLWRPNKYSYLLVVDDNEGFHRLCVRYLSAYSWQIAGATTGLEARRILAQQHPDVILLDIMMSHEDGWQVLATLKDSPATQAIPVIVCSVLNEPQLAQVLGAATYLAKPVSQKALLDVLNLYAPSHTNRGSMNLGLRTAPE